MFFQKELDQYFSHLKNVIVIADDISVVGKNHRDHDLALTSLLETARKCNVWLNYDKLQYKKSEVDFFGESYMINRCKPAQTKVSAMAAMSEPSCKKEVQSFIGIINYLSKFSARLFWTIQTHQIDVQRKVPFNWRPEHQEAFNVTKKEIVKAPILAYYDPKKRKHFTDRC